nr:hypothetical protein [Tanacetum cinerariifolium]
MVRLILPTKEMRLKSQAQATSINSTSFAPMVLLANSETSTRRPNDPTPGNWSIDTDASSHLNDFVSSLSDVFNMFIYPFVSDFMTRWVLLRCDSTGDLYPVTKPSTIPHDFLTSQYTWHQRLEHPRIPSGDSTRELVRVRRSVFHNGEDIDCGYVDENVVGLGIGRCPFGRFRIGCMQWCRGSEIDKAFDMNMIGFIQRKRSQPWSTMPPQGKKQRSLYGLKQAPRAWFQRFAAYITRIGFTNGRCDSSLFIYRHGTVTAYLLLYDLDSLTYFLGIFVVRDSSGMFLSQRKYVAEILERARMIHCNLIRTPIDTESKLGPNVQRVCLYMQDPREPHLSALKRILRCGLGWLSYYSMIDFSVKAEYRGLANYVAETCWLRNLLRELHTSLSSATLFTVIMVSTNDIHMGNVNKTKQLPLQQRHVQEQEDKVKEEAISDKRIVNEEVAMGNEDIKANLERIKLGAQRKRIEDYTRPIIIS